MVVVNPHYRPPHRPDFKPGKPNGCLSWRVSNVRGSVIYRHLAWGGEGGGGRGVLFVNFGG